MNKDSSICLILFVVIVLGVIFWSNYPDTSISKMDKNWRWQSSSSSE